MYIKLPKSNMKFNLESSTDFDKRLEIVNKVLTYNDNEILKYVTENNKIKSKSQLSSYTRSCYTLENLATYLLGRDVDKFNIAKPSKIKNIHNKEIPVSCADGNSYDLMYSSNISEEIEDMGINASENLTNRKFDTPVYKKNNTQINEDRQKEEKLKKRFRDTQTFKINKLHSTRKIKTYHVIPLKNSEITYKNEKNEEIMQSIPDFLFKEGKLDENEFKKWKNKNARNVFKTPILQDEVKYIGGNKGIIENPNYISKWCLVNTEGNFEFENKMYNISEEYEPYKVNEKDGTYVMDKILCIKTLDMTYFFDQNINKVEERYIKIAASPLLVKYKGDGIENCNQ